MNCAIVQPSYIPWRGYFHLIQKADVFVFYDDVQYTKRTWRNRNRIKTPGGPRWLTIPVHARGSITENIPIHRIPIAWDTPWNRSHRESLHQCYRAAPHYRRISDLLDRLYGGHPTRLADFTIESTRLLAAELGLEGRRFLRSSEIPTEGTAMQRVLALLRAAGATHFVNGPAARAYTDEDELRRAGITVEYMTYDYPAYPQLYPPYDPRVSVIDLLVMAGPDAPRYIWGDATRTES